jgi:hypothetical protein
MLLKWGTEDEGGWVNSRKRRRWVVENIYTRDSGGGGNEQNAETRSSITPIRNIPDRINISYKMVTYQFTMSRYPIIL